MQETRVHHKNLEFKVPTEFYKVEEQEKAPEPEVQSEESVTNPPDQEDSNKDNNDKIEATEQASSQDFETKDPKLQNPVEVNIDIFDCSNNAPQPQLYKGVMM